MQREPLKPTKRTAAEQVEYSTKETVELFNILLYETRISFLLYFNLRK